MPAHCGGSESPKPRTSVLNVMSSGCRKSPAVRRQQAAHALSDAPLAKLLIQQLCKHIGCRKPHAVRWQLTCWHVPCCARHALQNALQALQLMLITAASSLWCCNAAVILKAQDAHQRARRRRTGPCPSSHCGRRRPPGPSPPWGLAAPRVAPFPPAAVSPPAAGPDGPDM